MKEAYERNAKTALAITTVLTLFVAGYEVLTVMMHYQNGMNFFDIASFATVDIRATAFTLKAQKVSSKRNPD